MSFKIVSIETAFPKKFEYLNNKKSSKTNKIIDATGINKRFISSPNEDIISLSAISAKKSLKKINKNKIGFIIFVTQTSPYKLPTAACIMQNQLGLSENVFATDINLGCSGFIYSLKLAESLINLSSDKDLGLIICSDTYTKHISKNNRSCRPIFSDGSAAILLSYSKNDKIISFNFGADGSGTKDLYIPNTDIYNSINNYNNILMNGSDVALFAMSEIPKLVFLHLKKTKMSFSLNSAIFIFTKFFFTLFFR